ncbi:MAG: glycosyltransferase family 4 protein [Deltaproteobacteria bacterium]|nr:glycosyltransferase family 4 protein [Deltaproteobacteria bacterium]
METPLFSLKWRTKSPFLVPFRYAVQFTQTLSILFRESPNVVVSQHTHPFCSLAAIFYSKISGAVVVTDCHNGPFVDKIWQRWPLAPINRYVYRNADVNIVHNSGMKEFVSKELGLKGTFRVLHDPIPEIIGERGVPKSPTVTAICSFAGDEPIEALLRAASILPEITFKITGKESRMKPSLRKLKTDNIMFTDFLPDDEYDQLLLSSSATMALSTRRNLLMRACQEAIGASSPFITSEGAMAREYLSSGTVFVDNTPESIAEGVKVAIENAPKLQKEMEVLRATTKANWFKSIAELSKDLGLS